MRFHAYSAVLSSCGIALKPKPSFGLKVEVYIFLYTPYEPIWLYKFSFFREALDIACDFPL